jgi:hypothetical protein
MYHDGKAFSVSSAKISKKPMYAKSKTESSLILKFRINEEQEF